MSFDERKIPYKDRDEDETYTKAHKKDSIAKKFTVCGPIIINDPAPFHCSQAGYAAHSMVYS